MLPSSSRHPRHPGRGQTLGDVPGGGCLALHRAPLVGALRDDLPAATHLANVTGAVQERLTLDAPLNLDRESVSHDSGGPT